MAKIQTKGASTHSLKLMDRMRSVVAHHQTTCVKTLRDLLASWMTSLMTWLVIGIALALPAFLYLLLSNAGHLGGDFNGTARINLYLAEAAEARPLLDTITRLPEVSDATLITAAEALMAFESEAGFNSVLQSLPKNPLPDVIEITPVPLEPAQLRLLTTRLEAEVGVERVAIDIEWIERLFALLSLAERFVATLGVFLALGVVLAIGNTIRLAIENRRSEIEIIKLVGATDAFVRRPFLYLGFWYGFGGALLAFLMVQVGLGVLGGPIQQLLDSYQNQFTLEGMGFVASFSLFCAGTALGVVGAAIAVSRHLHTIEPS